MRGLFSLKSSSDLLDKLEYDYSALEKDKNNPYLAFNFFVTAEHMLDWVYPGYSNKSKRTSERDSEVLLQVCSHLATGAKHFVAEAKHHGSVSGSVQKRPNNPFYGPFGGPFVVKRNISGLYVNLEDKAAMVLGPTITAIDLAKHVFEYWQSHEKFSKSPT